MPNIIFVETLRRHTRQAIYWGVGFALYGLYVMLAIPDTEGLQQYVNLIGSMPSFLLQTLGISDLEMLMKPEGIIALTYSAYIVLLLAVYAVLAALNITANEEDAGIMDMILSLPVARWRVIAEKFAAYSLLLLLIALGGFIGLVVGMQLNPHVTLAISRLFESSLNLLPIGMVIMATTALLAVVVRRKATAAAIAGVWVGVSFVIDMIGKSANEGLIANARALSVFKYYDSHTLLETGINWASFSFLLILSLVLVSLAINRFQQRDIGV